MTGTEHISPEHEWIAPRGAAAEAWPRPATQRWQPLRLGLVDLFYYDDEQFWFHDGRLLLRGNNGTGKSKVLALTLPFLLDGSVSPRRIEPDADPKKRMEWNLLLGGAHPSTERSGYTWAEFGRIDADGTEHFTTLGIGLKAAAGRGLVKTWFFTSTRRIGDLHLVDDQRVVLTQERLRDELADTRSGQVYTTRDAYRRAVDEALFQLGEDRYGALIDLLVQLRQPQLSKKPDEKALSAALTEALTPLDQAVVADVAESFRSLEEERAAIAMTRDTLGAAEKFLGHYRAYAGIAARRRTTAVRETNSAYEWAGRNFRDAEQALADAVTEVERLTRVHDELTERRSALEGERQALQESPAMKDAARLDEASRAADDMEAHAARADTEVERARSASERDAEAAAMARGRYDDVVADADRRGVEAARLAAPAGLAADHAALTADEDVARRALARRREQVVHVRGLLSVALKATDGAAQRRTLLDSAETDRARRGEQVTATQAAVESAVTAHREAVRRFLAGLRLLEVAEGSEDTAEEWARSLSGDSPVRAAVEEAARSLLERTERERAEAEQEQRRISATLTELRTEISVLESGHDPEPPPMPGRAPGIREGRAGAPLWRITDFRDGVTETQGAALEAALASAGILDAWVFPDGTLSTADDVVLGPSGPRARSALGDMLMPAVGPGMELDGDIVAAVLDRIGLGETSESAFWVDTDGSWGAGPARGSWTKTRAEFIGTGAREVHRRALLVDLRARVAEIEDALSASRAQIATIDRQKTRIGEERANYPKESERALFTAHERAVIATSELENAEQRVFEVRTDWEKASVAAEQAAREVADQAEQLSLGATERELEATSAAIAAYAEALIEMRTTARSLDEADRVREQAAERAAESARLLDQRGRERTELAAGAASLRARFEALHSTVGASVAELQARLSAAESEQVGVGERIRTTESSRIEAAGERGTLEQKVQDLGVRREETAAARDIEVGALRRFAATGLMRVALPTLETPDPGRAEEWQITTTLALARNAEQQLDGIDESDDVWSRAQQRVSSASTELTTQMSRHGHTAFVEQHGDVMVARVRYRGDEVDIDRLAIRLAADVADREQLLSAREREILENHLVNEVAGHLHELLLAAEGQIGGMNRELAERKTSTGMQLRVRWRERADGPPGLAAARGLMLRSDATWTAADRTAIGDFLQAQITMAREADPTGGWQEHLERALDYRQWHSFTVERLQQGTWRSASGPASGGEKALAVSVPLFAAAAAHYNSAGTLAPRLILLDEAFAGVDDDSRAKSLGLLATFDLDVVMTSEREWGCYPQVPGLSIAQLSRVEGVDAVGVTRWRWDGRRRERIGEIDAVARASGTSSGPDDPSHDTLFG